VAIGFDLPGSNLLGECNFVFQDGDFPLSDISTVDPNEQLASFHARHIPSQGAKFVCGSRIIHRPILTHPEIHRHPHLFIGQMLDATPVCPAKPLIKLALPSGIEPLSPP
jgi:hypothetical protein